LCQRTNHQTPTEETVTAIHEEKIKQENEIIAGLQLMQLKRKPEYVTISKANRKNRINTIKP